MKIVLCIAIVILVSGCLFPRNETAVLVKKYSAPPPRGEWQLVSDTAQFWEDVSELYKASVLGDRRAFRALLTIEMFADGVVGEGMPDIYWVAREYPEMASQVISADERLKARFGHWLKQIKDPSTE